MMGFGFEKMVLKPTLERGEDQTVLLFLNVRGGNPPLL